MHGVKERQSVDETRAGMAQGEQTAGSQVIEGMATG